MSQNNKLFKVLDEYIYFDSAIAFDLFFFPDREIIKTLDKIYLQLRTNLIEIRPNRHYNRPNEREGKNTRGIQSAEFLKRRKKSGF